MPTPPARSAADATADAATDAATDARDTGAPVLTPASPWRVILTDAQPPLPWRNGLGLTRELWAWPSAADWAVRLSVADIGADAAFSAFPGVTRWFTVLAGAGVELTVDDQTHHQTRASAPLRFAGEAAVDCRLVAGPTRDLNLMLRGCAGGLEPVTVGRPWQADDGALRHGLFSAVAGRCHIGANTAITLPARALLLIDGAPQPLRFEPDPCTPSAPRGAAPGWWWQAGPMTPSL
jgi:environmental stress-induced protein Ves